MQKLIDLLNKLGRDNVIAGAEVGVSKGATSRQLLIAFPKLVLWMIDSWTVFPEEHPYRQSGDGHARLSQQDQERHYQAAVAATSFAEDRRHIKRMRSLEAVRMFVDNYLDFAFIDADHTYEAVLADIEAYWPKVRELGVLCGHDLDHPRDKRGLWGVRRAATEFAERLGLPLRQSGDLWWISKPKDSRTRMQQQWQREAA